MKTFVLEEQLTVKQVLQDILLEVTWSKIAKNYFGKSSSWLYHKLNGIDGNGNENDFTQDERMQLKDALIDLSDRIRAAAEEL
ncbi:MAG: DUF5053 domain-containing protein [Bacteroidales bacterium]|jgi:hypothetical protein|nr:DUF5053 domain-containing protein [Bacteroidales bacterium]